MSRNSRRERGGGLDRLRSRLDQPRRVLLRDFVIFELKVLLDGFKDVIISQAALGAVIVDLIRPGGRNFGLFYRVLSFAERADLWLNLYSASHEAAEHPEGLFGVSREGSPTLLGQLEHLVHRMVVGEHPQSGPGAELFPSEVPAGSAPRRPAAPRDVPPETAGPG